MAERAGAANGPAVWPAYPRQEVFPAAPRNARVVVRADLVPAFGVLSVVGVLGIALGWVWSLLAPTQRMRVVTDGGEAVPLQWESWHRFDGLALFVLLGLAVGVLTGVAVWLLRARRGPVVLIGAVAGSVLAAWLATRLGPAF
ncbi:DUF2567 domain-containing protein, partial [Saccharomonospora saliphila]|uniref:DUF2567 domain-containing protein n=1 Tax=Saccharomonospora saliphila TaxID=369829 RepID=UPI0003758D8C